MFMQHLDVSMDRAGAATAAHPTRLYHSQQDPAARTDARNRNFPVELERYFGSGSFICRQSRVFLGNLFSKSDNSFIPKYLFVVLLNMAHGLW